MPLMTWTDRMSVGVAVLDEDHRKLVAMVNELYDAMQAGQGKEKLGRVLEAFRHVRLAIIYCNCPRKTTVIIWG